MTREAAYLYYQRSVRARRRAGLLFVKSPVSIGLWKQSSAFLARILIFTCGDKAKKLHLCTAIAKVVRKLR